MSYLESLFSLRGKNALVTGAASGLGRRCAVVLAQAGARVALVDVNLAGLVETAATIDQAVTLPADVTRSDEVERMLTNAVEALGQIDIAVTCAGVALWKPALEVPEEEFDRVFAVNVKGTWLVAQAVRPAPCHLAIGSRPPGRSPHPEEPGPVLRHQGGRQPPDAYHGSKNPASGIATASRWGRRRLAAGAWTVADASGVWMPCPSPGPPE